MSTWWIKADEIDVVCKIIVIQYIPTLRKDANVTGQCWWHGLLTTCLLNSTLLAIPSYSGPKQPLSSSWTTEDKTKSIPNTIFKGLFPGAPLRFLCCPGFNLQIKEIKPHQLFNRKNSIHIIANQYISVHCLNQVPHMNGLKQQNYIVSQSWRNLRGNPEGPGGNPLLPLPASGVRWTSLAFPGLWMQPPTSASIFTCPTSPEHLFLLFLLRHRSYWMKGHLPLIWFHSS